MFRTAMLICLAGLYQATAAPYTAVAPTEERQHSAVPAKLVLSLAEDAEDTEGEEGLDLDSAPDDDVDTDDLDFVTRELRNKNFLRFGRSASQAPRSGDAKDGNTIRFNRGEPDDNFIRLGRSANFVRLGRGGSDNTVKTPSIRSSNSHFIRLGRANKNAFLRLGRDGSGEDLDDIGEGNESLPRDTRAGSSSNFIRLGKAGYPSSSGFIRLGRKDNFLRFGKADNFLRFGRGVPNSNFIRLGRADNFLRFGRGGSSSNFIRLGKADNFLRFGRGGASSSNFIRLGKADRFIRLGRNAPNFNEFRFAEGKGVDGARFGRGKLADRNFIRLGRSDPEAERGSGEGVPDNAKTGSENSWATFIRHAPRTIRLGKRDLDDDNNNNNRSKRSIDFSAEEELDSEEEELPLRFYRPLSSKIPNYVFAPELAVLPPLYSKRGTGTGSSNFIRLG